jgi:FtsH-binding integral membrane protein
MATTPQLQGRSFLWAFLLFVALFLSSVLLFALGQTWGIALLAAAGFIPFLVQAATGHGLDNRWVARYSRGEHPIRFWLLIALSLAVAAWFSYAAYSVYVAASVRAA